MTTYTKTFRVRVSLRNNHLVSRREDLGLSQDQLAEAIGVHKSTVCGFETFRRSPVGPDGRWRPSAKRVAAFHNCLPEDLWPEEALLVQKSAADLFMSGEDVKALLPLPREEVMSLPIDPEAEVASREMGENLLALVESLPERHRKVVKDRMGFGVEERTFTQIGNDLGVSKTRAADLFWAAVKEIARRGVLRGVFLADETPWNFSGHVPEMFHGGEPPAFVSEATVDRINRQIKADDPRNQAARNPIRFPCRQCDAIPGEECRAKSGSPFGSRTFHSVREEAAVRHLAAMLKEV